MRFYAVLASLGLLLGFCQAQGDMLSALPQCAADCFKQTLSTTTCDSSDIACLCADTDFQTAAQGCEAQSCTTKEVLTATNVTLAACGVPIADVSDTVLAIPASFGSLAILLVLIRIFGRLYLTKVSLGWDDYLIASAMVVACVLNFVCYPMALEGMGKDLWAIPFDNIYDIFLYLYLAEIFYMFAEMLVQLSILSFYIRVFPENSHFVRKGSWSLMGIVICFGIANTFTMIFQCLPVSYFWTSWAGETTGTCIDINMYSWIRAAIEIAIDITIMSLPLPAILHLQMGWKKKIQIMMMFLVGFIITLVSILRLQSLIQFSKTTNPTHDNAPAIYWSVLECDMFIICACLPPVRSILSKCAPGVFGSSNGNSGYHRSGEGGHYRHQNSGNSYNTSKASHGSQGGKITKSIDVNVYQEQRAASDEELVVYPRHRPIPDY